MKLPRAGRERPRRGRPMAGHGSFPKEMAHAVGRAPCKIEVEVPRHRREKRGITVSEEVGFASAVSANVTEALEERVVGSLRQRAIVKETAALCGAPYDTARLVIDGAHVRRPNLPKTPLMDETHSRSYREPDTGKQVAVRWACAHDGEDGKPVDVIDGHDTEAPGRWHSQFSAEERNRVKEFRGDMHDPFLNTAAKWLPLAARAVDRFHVAKDGVAHMDGARRRIQKGAGNGASIKRRARKPAAQPGKRSRERAGEAWAGHEKRATCDVPRRCDEKRSHLRQALLVLQLRYEWQDGGWDGRREECDKALRDWIMKATGLCVPETAAFGQTVADCRQQPVAGTAEHVDSARAEPANDKIKELKKRGRGFGGYAETRKRLLIALGKPDAVELPTARAPPRADRGAQGGGQGQGGRKAQARQAEAPLADAGQGRGHAARAAERSSTYPRFLRL